MNTLGVTTLATLHPKRLAEFCKSLLRPTSHLTARALGRAGISLPKLGVELLFCIQ